MAKLLKTTVFKAATKPETAMDKTTRIVRRIVDDEAEQRQVKNARLRKARLEREASTSSVNAAAEKADSAQAVKWK